MEFLLLQYTTALQEYQYFSEEHSKTTRMLQIEILKEELSR